MSKPVLQRRSGSDLAQVDAHQIEPHEYEELPELSEEALSRAIVNKGGRPRLDHPRRLISLRLPPDVIERWKASGPGWQTRMADWLANGPVPDPAGTRSADAA